MARESGHLGVLTSLGGATAPYGIGREVYQDPLLIGTTQRNVLPANNGRISALIQHTPTATPANYIGVFIHGVLVAKLLPYGSIQIDENFPTTLDIDCVTDTGTATVLVTEVRIPSG